MSARLLTATAAALFAATPVLAQPEPLEGDPAEINFGIISTESQQNLERQWQPFLEDMEEALGMPINAFYASDYAGVIEAMRFGQVTVAWFGNASAMQAVDRAGGEIFAQTTKIDGTRGYYSHILVNADSELQTLDDLLAHCGDDTIDFGIGDPNSTSGFLVPSYYVFALNGVTPQDCFASVRNANHETNLLAVANGLVHAATNNSEQLARTEANAPDAAAAVRVLWTSPLIPSDPMVLRADLSDELKGRITDFFLRYGVEGDNVEEELAILAANQDGMGPYVASDNNQLLPIRQLRLFRERLEVEADEDLSDADKSEQLAAIDDQLAALNAQMEALGQ